MSKISIIQQIKNSLKGQAEVKHPGEFHLTQEMPTQEALLETYKTNLISVGGKWLDLKEFLNSYNTNDKSCYSNLYPNLSNFSPDEDDPKSFEPLDDLIIRADFSVAENGAIWIQNPQNFHRSALFLCKNLFVVLDTNKILRNMHEAYEAIDLSENYGVFISGPSKTADVEQCLVIGAHGPLSLTILLEQ